MPLGPASENNEEVAVMKSVVIASGLSQQCVRALIEAMPEDHPVILYRREEPDSLEDLSAVLYSFMPAYCVYGYPLSSEGALALEDFVEHQDRSVLAKLWRRTTGGFERELGLQFAVFTRTAGSNAEDIVIHDIPSMRAPGYSKYLAKAKGDCSSHLRIEERASFLQTFTRFGYWAQDCFSFIRPIRQEDHGIDLQTVPKGSGLRGHSCRRC
jgi:hypothetical protein